MRFCESVAIGHPDKVADQISDAIVDAYLAQDPTARVDCSTLISHDTLVLAGEITSRAAVDCKKCAESVLERIGYPKRKNVILEIKQQSSDIADAILHTGTLGAGDQGIMIGYATDETEEYLPLEVVTAHKLMRALKNESPELGPDGKALVGVSDGVITHIILSCQHAIELEEAREKLSALIKRTVQVTPETIIRINPAGRFVVGGPDADTGITGRKLMVDCYGTAVEHGGGAFSGKDPTKVDRSASYMARYIAKNIVASKLAKRCKVALTYVIGDPYPTNISIDTFGGAQNLEQEIPKLFDLSVAGIIRTLDLQKPIYEQSAWGGHFGRHFPWEAICPIKI